MAIVECRFDRSGPTLDAIERAAYRFIDQFALESAHTEDEWCCRLDFPPDCDAIDAVVRDFKAEVLDQTLRARIRTETEGVRNLILSVAFAPIVDSDR